MNRDQTESLNPEPSTRSSSWQMAAAPRTMSSDMVSVSSAGEKTDALMDTSMNISPESAQSRAESDSDSDIKALDNHGDTDHDPAADEELRRLQVLYPTHE
jgi:hypothetical protein